MISEPTLQEYADAVERLNELGYEVVAVTDDPTGLRWCRHGHRVYIRASLPISEFAAVLVENVRQLVREAGLSRLQLITTVAV